MGPYFKKFKVKDVPALAIYKYEDVIKEQIFRYKGCYDYELKKVFLSPYLKEIRLLYHGYVLIPAPSFKDSDVERGFNHVEELCKELKLPTFCILGKSKNISLHQLGFEERSEGSKSIFIADPVDLTNKKVLLVDDICTTGSTLSKCIDLIRSLNPQKLRILVVAKREFTKEERKNLSKDYKVLE